MNNITCPALQETIGNSLAKDRCLNLSTLMLID